MNLNIYIDGGSRGNPGPAAAGVVIASAEPEFAVHEAGYFIGRTTNNVAEYQGLIRALEVALELQPDEVRIFSDSELLVKQITGEYRVKSPDLKPLYAKATALLLKFDLWHIKHIYREANARADELANLAMDAKRDVIVTSGAAFKNTAPKPKKLAPKLPFATDEEVDVAPTRSAVPQAVPNDDATPRWTATLTSDPGIKCPAACLSGEQFTFGPDTPKGLCIYAAQAIFEDGPLDWSDRHEKTCDVKCDHCGAGIRIELIKK